jgi:hypothetical protein
MGDHVEYVPMLLDHQEIQNMGSASDILTMSSATNSSTDVQPQNFGEM